MNACLDPADRSTLKLIRQLLRLHRRLVEPVVSASLLPALAADARASVRRQVARLIGQSRRLRDPAVRSLLRELAADREPSVRQEAIAALRRLFDEAPPLVRTELTSVWSLSSKPHVRVAAAAALAERADHPGGSTALAYLQQDPTQRVRLHAMMATV